MRLMIRQGNVVLVRFSYSDLSSSKVRPALVLSGSDLLQRQSDLILAAISSKPVRSDYEMPIRGWREAGLKFPSKVICSKLITVLSDLAAVVGSLNEDDLRTAKETVRRVFDL